MIAGRYTLVREIGRGGMGAVWLASDEVLGRQVAIKRIGVHPSADAPDLERAEREARITARLNHPKIVAVFDLVRDGENQWLVMEYVEGVTLSELATGGLSPDEAAPLLRQAAEALAAAHAAGIVHRDVKPSNILVTPDGVAKLLDFGIARGQSDSTLTQTGMVTGSPAYLAPEVVSGGAATPASDVWSLGATLQHALTGRPPYDVGDNVVAALYRIVHEEPPRAANAGHLLPLLEGTMCVDPARRWTMEQVRDFLETGAEVRAEPVVIAPAPDFSAAPAPDPTRAVTSLTPARERGPAVPWWALAAVAAIVLATVLAFSLGNRNNDDPGPTATGTDTAVTDSPEPDQEPGVTEDDLVAFVQDYLAAATSDPGVSFARLTSSYQDASGGIRGYERFWRPIRSAEVSDIAADPASLQVSYTVSYDRPGPRGGAERVTLQLVEQDGELFIADQLSP